MYRTIIQTKGLLKEDRKKYEYTFVKDGVRKKFIIEKLQSNGIKYFDQWVENDITVELLGPDAFEQSLRKKWFTFAPDDKLVNSMFYLAHLYISFQGTFIAGSDYNSMINLDEPVCPSQIADI